MFWFEVGVVIGFLIGVAVTLIVGFLVAAGRADAAE